MRRTAKRPLVLLTNIWLGGRSGTEVVTLDFAAGLARRGWRTAIYAARLRDGAAAPDGVELVRSLADLDRAPDLVHGHQHPPLAAALMQFRGAPAIQMIHDARSWHDRGLAWQRVRAVVAVDEACRERAVRDLARTSDEIAILPNALDLSRCQPRGPLPRRPARVLVVANRLGEHVPAVLAACAAAGLEAQSVGYGVGRPSTTLEADMRDADIVVGAARIALEAMAVGCAALVCDVRGLAGLATPGTFDHWRAWNFGHRLLTAPVTAETVGAALAAYDADAAAEVTRRVRAECGLEPALDRLEALYRDAMDGFDAGTIDQTREGRDTDDYLRAWLPTTLLDSPFEYEVRTMAGADHRLRSVIAEFARRGITINFDAPQDGGG